MNFSDIKDGNHLLVLPLEGQMQFHNIGRMSLEEAGILATELLGLPIALMTEHKTPYAEVLPTIIVYHSGQDGRYEVNHQAAAGLGALGIDHEYQGDVVLLFMEGMTA